jgi:hypothetical protein
MGWSRQRAGTVMAISRVSSTSAQATTITIPTHQSGDLILIGAARNNSTPPTLPAGWVQIAASGAGLTNNSITLGWKIAKSSIETSGTWTNAISLHCAVYRGSAGYLHTNTSAVTTSTTTTVNYAALTGQRIGILDCWYLAFVFQNDTTNLLETAPTGMTNVNVETIAGIGKSAFHDTNSTLLAAWTTRTVTLANAAASRPYVINLIEIDAPAFGGGGFRPVNIRGGADQ